MSDIDDMMEYVRDDVELGVLDAFRTFGGEIPKSSISGRNIVCLPLR
jgi:hypothetical protein